MHGIRVVKNIEKRLQLIEETLKPKEKPSAWIVIVACDRAVSTSHIKPGIFEFKHIDEFEEFRKEKGIVEDNYIQVIMVDAGNCKGEPPKEL